MREPLEALPRFEVSGVPGARASLRVGFVSTDGLRLRAACVEAPSDRWAPGIEEIVLGVATGVLRRALGEELAIERLDAEAIVARGDVFAQALSGVGLRGQTRVSITGKHLLGFEGASPEVVLCSVSCEEPLSGLACAGLVTKAEVSPLVAAPPPSLLVRALLLSAEHPREVFSVLFFAVCLGVALLLARRPRPLP